MAGHHIGVLALICSFLFVLPLWSENIQSNVGDDKPILPSWTSNESIMVDNDETPIIEELKKGRELNSGEPHGKSKKRKKTIKKKNKKKKKLKKNNKKKNKYKNNSTRIGGTGEPGDEEFCSSSSPCQVEQGDCDGHDECAGSLICSSNTCKDFHPSAHKDADCCIIKPGTGGPDDEVFCSSSSPCQEKQGDCDGHNECAGSLICSSNTCKDFHPLAHKDADCCIKKNYNYCGIENRNRISGGSETAENQYPWMVRLPMGCGGSLITKRHILTAKHCVDEGSAYWWGQAVKVSVHNQYDWTDYREIPIKAVKWPRGNDHDLAMIILEWHVDLTDATIGTVCLPSGSTTDFRGKVATAMGWGMTHYDSDPSPVLKHVELTVSQRQRKNWLYTQVPRINGVYQDPCAGDSGGPLVYRNVMSGRWTIIGTLKGKGYNCKTNNINGEGKWNKVTDHLNWIRSVIRN